jgi:hypothetical protein
MNQQSCLAGNLDGHVYRRNYLRRQLMIGTNEDGLIDGASEIFIEPPTAKITSGHVVTLPIIVLGV